VLEKCILVIKGRPVLGKIVSIVIQVSISFFKKKLINEFVKLPIISFARQLIVINFPHTKTSQGVGLEYAASTNETMRKKTALRVFTAESTRISTANDKKRRE